ncbi:MAG TPA: 50S ribosomal protein L25, partial [Ilumatobacter sp.]|nr:50S ribosomal protein L25 [Ilumatobacter sp.]
MSDTVLIAETGRTTGSASSRRLVATDVIPAVVYGQGMQPLQISVARRDLRVALSGPAGTNTVLDLTVDGTVYPAIVKDMQRHPVKRTVQHVDFIQINLKEDITVSIPVRLEGEAKEVLAIGGFVDLILNTIEVVTTPRLIPDEIVIDISDFTLESMLTIADITLPEGVVATADADVPVVTAVPPRVEEEPETEAAEEGAAGEA